jgi:hypothetical protein
MRLSLCLPINASRVPRTWLPIESRPRSAGHRFCLARKTCVSLVASVWHNGDYTTLIYPCRQLGIYVHVVVLDIPCLLIAAIMADQLIHKNRTSGPLITTFLIW